MKQTTADGGDVLVMAGAEAEELARRLRDQRLLMVVGDSGSGKSSLVGAGLVPRWRGGALAKAEGRLMGGALRHG